MNKHDVLFSDKDAKNTINIYAWSVSELKELLDCYDDDTLLDIYMTEETPILMFVPSSRGTYKDLERKRKTNLNHFKLMVDY